MIEEVAWGTEAALAIFFGGLGGGAFIIATITSYISGEKFRDIMKYASIIGVISALLCIILFALDAGHPERATYLYTHFPTSMISFGTSVLSLIIPLGLVYASFFFPYSSLPFLKKLIPWHGNVDMRKALEVIMFVLGSGLVAYTSFVLALARINAFWESPLISVLFFASGVSTALMAVGLCLSIAYQRQPIDRKRRLYVEMMHRIDVADGYMLILELSVALLYLYTMLNDPLPTARYSALALIYGPLSILFWGAFIGIGIVIPIILLILLAWRGRTAAFIRLYAPLMALAAILVLFGGAAMRYAILIAGQYPFIFG